MHRAHPRRLVALRGAPTATAADAARRLLAARDGLWIGATSSDAPPGFETTPPRRLRRYLGRAFDAVVLDDPDPEALGRAHGCVRGGGWLVLRLDPDAPDTRWRRRLRAAIARAGGGRAPAHFTPAAHHPTGTAEQARAVERLRAVFAGPPGGVATLDADRGRGKSAALGRAARDLAPEAVALTGPGAAAVAEVQRFAPGLAFTPIEALLHGPARPAVIAVDEAAQIPVPALRRLVERHPQARFGFATTTRGYEGTGRGYVLRFTRWLEAEQARRGAPLERLGLTTPIRWAPDDPVERFVFDALLLDAEPSAFAADADPGPLTVARLDRDALAADEARLRAVFGLLVHAHYRTTPRDLATLLDAPGVHLFAVSAPEADEADGADGGARVAAINLLVEEGRLPPETCAALARGRMNLRGQALPETLAADAGRPDAGRLSMIRSVRIATHPALRRRGLARRLTAAVHAAFAPDLFGTLFGATPALLAFRRRLGYRLVRLGISGGRRAGEPAAVMIRPCSAAARALVADLRGHLARDLPRQLERMATDQTLDPALVTAAQRGLPPPAPLDPATRDAITAAYAFGPRGFEAAALPVQRFVEAHRAQLTALDPAARRLIEGRVLAGESWSTLGALSGVTAGVSSGGVRAAMRALRRAVRALVRAVDPTLEARYVADPSIPGSPMSPAALDALIDHFLPLLVTAGDFARAVQANVQSPAQKAGSSPWTQALTDADLAVQTFVEVAAKAYDPALGFYGEEWARSTVHKYFDPNAETRITLDPINGTLLYQSGLDGWDIVLGVTHRERLVAAISYTPARGLFYVARRDRGLVTGDRDAPRLGAMQPWKRSGGARVVLGCQTPDVLAAAKGRFETYDIDTLDPRPPFENLNDLFTGRLAAFACRGVLLLDWGAVAFMAHEAGGRVTHVDGAPFEGFAAFDPAARSDLLVSADPAAHAELCAALAEAGA